MEHKILSASKFAASLVAFACVATMALAHPDAAHVDVKDAWVRAAVAGQSGTGGFMKLTAHENLKLVGIASPAAGVVELHEMTKNGDVMQMRAIKELNLPRGQTVELKAGSYHLMLMQIKAPLVKDSKVPVTLFFVDAKGEKSKLNVQVPVRMSAPDGALAPAMEHKH